MIVADTLAGDAAYSARPRGTLRQAFSPPELIGRVSASITFVLISVVPLRALLGGALLVAGMGVLLTPLCLIFSPVRSLRTVALGRA